MEQCMLLLRACWLGSIFRRTSSVGRQSALALDGDAVDWPIAFERIHPDRYSRRIDYYEGAAGIASALLQIYLDETGNFRWSRLPDDPFPERL